MRPLPTTIGVLAFVSIVGSFGARNAHAAAAPAACRPSEITIRIGPRISEATGQQTVALRFRNNGSDTCTLSGYPSLTLSDQRGRIPFRFRDGGDMMITRHRPQPVLLHPSGSAYALFNKFRCDLGRAREADRVAVRLHRDTPVVAARRLAHPTIPYCTYYRPGGWTVDVSPYEPTIRAALSGG